MHFFIYITPRAVIYTLKQCPAMHFPVLRTNALEVNLQNAPLGYHHLICFFTIYAQSLDCLSSDLVQGSCLPMAKLAIDVHFLSRNIISISSLTNPQSPSWAANQGCVMTSSMLIRDSTSRSNISRMRSMLSSLMM